MQIFLTYIVDIHRNSQIFLWRCPKSWGYSTPSLGGVPQYLAQAARVLTLNAASRSEMRPQSLMRMEAWRWNLAGYVQTNRFYIYIQFNICIYIIQNLYVQKLYVQIIDYIYILLLLILYIYIIIQLLELSLFIIIQYMALVYV